MGSWFLLDLVMERYSREIADAEVRASHDSACPE